MSAPASARVVALCGGVGGAKLALGLYRVLGPDALTVIVNTGDDFEHLGLHVSPDLDTVLYTLAGRADPVLGSYLIANLGRPACVGWFVEPATQFAHCLRRGEATPRDRRPMPRHEIRAALSGWSCE